MQLTPRIVLSILTFLTFMGCQSVVPQPIVLPAARLATLTSSPTPMNSTNTTLSPGKMNFEQVTHGVVDDIEFSPSGDYVAVINRLGDGAWIWNMKQLDIPGVFVPTTAFISELRFQENSQAIAVSECILRTEGCAKAQVTLMDFPTLQVLTSLPTGFDPSRKLEFSTSGRLIAYYRSVSELQLFDTMTNKVDVVLQSFWSYPFAFSPDGKSFVYVKATSGDRYLDEITLLDLNTNIEVSLNRKIVRYPISADLAFTPDGQYLIGSYCSNYGEMGTKYCTRNELTMWETGHYQIQSRAETAELYSLAVSSDGKLIAGHDDARVYLWRIADKTLSEFKTLDYTPPIYSIAFWPDSEILVVLTGTGLSKIDLSR